MDVLIDGYERNILVWTQTRIILESSDINNVVHQAELVENIETIKFWVDSEELGRMRQFTELSEPVDYLLLHLNHIKEIYNLSSDSKRQDQLSIVDDKFKVIRATLGEFRRRLDEGFAFLIQAQVFLILMLMILIVIAMQDRTRQRINLEASRRIQSEIARAQEEERNRIALDLHDDIAQELSWIRLRMADSDTNPDQLDIVDNMIGKIRNISLNLRTPDFQTEFFDDVVKDLIIAAEQNSKLQIRYISGSKHPGDQPEIYGQLYRIIQECLNNARKHAGDCRVFIEIQEEAKIVYLEYRDDGKGFDIADTKDKRRLGLPGIRNRVRMMDGKLEVRASPGKGLNLSCSIPVKGEK